MATELQRNRLRADLATTATAIPDAVADDLFTRAEERYGSGTAAADAYARVLAIRQLRAAAARDVDYTANSASERLSQRFAQLKALEDMYNSLVQEALNEANGGAVAWGGLRRKPSRIESYPDSYFYPDDPGDVTRD